MNLDGLYLGGGYPELYADTLSRNTRMRAEIRAFVGVGQAGVCGVWWHDLSGSCR